MAKRRATMKSFQSAITRVLMDARAETLRGIAAYHGKSAAETVQKDGTAGTMIFNLAKFLLEFHSAVEKQQKAALQTAGEQLYDEMKRDDAFAYPPAKVLEYVKARENRLKNVPQEIFDRVKRELEAGITAGDTQDQLSARVKSVFNDIADGKARTIAATETSAAYGNGRDQAMRQAGVRYKAWLTSGNANVRAAHQQAGLDYPPDRAIPIDEPFIVDGEALMHPGDNSGSPENVINCHCVSIPTAAPSID